MKSKIHISATQKAEHFRSCMKNRSASIDVQLNNLTAQQVEKNRRKLKPIVEAVILLGRGNIPFRGHRDDLQFYDGTRGNPGNLQALIQLLYRCGNNPEFQDHIENAPKSATFRSKTTQNELINICGSMISEEISNKIKNAKFFSILADEAIGLSGRAIAAKILNSLKELGLDPSFCRGQGYYGAGKCQAGTMELHPS